MTWEKGKQHENKCCWVKREKQHATNNIKASYLIHCELFQSSPAIPYEIHSAHTFPNEVSLKTVPHD